MLSEKELISLRMINRYPDDEAGEVPMAFVVRQPQSSLGATEVIDFVAKQVLFSLLHCFLLYIQSKISFFICHLNNNSNRMNVEDQTRFIKLIH